MRLPSNIKGEAVASVPASFIFGPFILITPRLSPFPPLFCSIFPSLCFVFRLTVTGSILPQGSGVMSPMSFHSQLYNAVGVYMCVDGSMKVKRRNLGVQQSR